MKKQLLIGLAIMLLSLTIPGLSQATIIDFSGGTAYLSNGSTVVTNDTDLYFEVDYYVEEGFKFDFIGANEIIGDYYGLGNSVIHGHFGWGMTEILVSKIDGTAFDLNYLEITSNTEIPGGAATGNEQTYITSSNGSSELLASSNWGDGGDGNAMHWLSSGFDDITFFSITIADLGNDHCFGMDSFYIDEPAPPNPNNPIPEPSTIILIGVGFLGIIGYNRKKKLKKIIQIKTYQN